MKASVPPTIRSWEPTCPQSDEQRCLVIVKVHFVVHLKLAVFSFINPPESIYSVILSICHAVNDLPCNMLLWDMSGPVTVKPVLQAYMSTTTHEHESALWKIVNNVSETKNKTHLSRTKISQIQTRIHLCWKNPETFIRYLVTHVTHVTQVATQCCHSFNVVSVLPQFNQIFSFAPHFQVQWGRKERLFCQCLEL